MTVTLLISTYNWPQALRLCILSALSQSRMPDQIVICDDGSTSETAETVKALQASSPVRIDYVWQEDKGFRAAKSRNRGMAVATGEYIIQVDGDMLMHREFVADHLALARKGFLIRGRRIMLTPEATEHYCVAGELPRLDFRCKGVAKRRFNAIHMPRVARWIAPHYRQGRTGFMGCNMSFWREDFMAVNGYDEFFEGWGSEDSDLGIRMTMNGVRHIDLKFAGIAFHLHHGHPFMHNRKKNQDYSERDRVPGEIRARKGLDQYLA